MFDWMTHTMNSMGYGGIVFLMALENIFPPIPSELIMPFAGFLTERGDLQFWGVVVAGMVGSVLGGLPWYYLAKKLGEDRLKQWADKHGAWLTLSGEDIAGAKEWFDRHGGAAVFFCRLIPGVRTFISVPAGFSDMNVGLFLLYSALGTGLWAGILAYIGKLLGQNYGAVGKYLGPATYVVLGGIVAFCAYEVWRRKKEGKNKPKDKSKSEQPA